MSAEATTTRGPTPWAGDLGAAAVADLAPRPGERILHAGCGTAGISLELARAVGPSGAVMAVDPVAGLLEEAAELAEREGLPVRFRVADLGAAPAPPFAADAALLVRALSRGRDPRRALAAAVSALVPGGRAVVAEPDWSDVRLDHPDPALTRRVLSARRMGIDRPELAGEVPAMMAAAGLRDVRARATVTEARGLAAVEALLQVRAAALAPAHADGVPAAAARGWWRALLDADARDPVVARLPGTVVTGLLPAG